MSATPLAQYQYSGTGIPRWNAVIINSTCALPAMTFQNVCRGKGLKTPPSHCWSLHTFQLQEPWEWRSDCVQPQTLCVLTCRWPLWTFTRQQPVITYQPAYCCKTNNQIIIIDNNNQINSAFQQTGGDVVVNEGIHRVALKTPVHSHEAEK